jgi:hypothetical protein
MTRDDINNGLLICVIGVAPVTPAKFVNFGIRVASSSGDFCECACHRRARLGLPLLEF